MSERYNPERFKRILRTGGPERAKAYIESRRGARLRAEDESRAAAAHIREAMDVVNHPVVTKEHQPEPILWAGAYPQYLMLITPSALVYEPGVPQGRQIGQGLSFG